MSYYTLGQTDKYGGNFAPYCLSYEKAAGHPYVPCNCIGHVEKEEEIPTNKVYYTPPSRSIMMRSLAENERRSREERGR